MKASQKAAEFVRSYFEAWNRQDANAIADHLAENGTYLDMPDQKPLTRAELIATLEESFRDNDNHYELVGKVLSDSETLAFQYKVTPNGGTGPASYGAESISLRKGSALQIADYYESPELQTPRSPLAQVQRYAKSGLSESQLEQLKSRVQQAMIQDQAYLDPDLTLPGLANLLSCSVNHLSQVINAGFGRSFFDYVNEYRVRDAMELLSHSDEGAPTVLQVALDVGFNSTSTFYVAFKKVTGKTPAQYRKEI